MVMRTAKLVLLASIAFYYTLVVFNNLTDFDSNYQFVRHVLSMDTTLPGNHGLWRALPQPGLQLTFYIGIIAWEAVTAILLWWGFARLIRARTSPAAFNAAKGIAIAALTLSLTMWLVAFITVGGEWFLMWQSRIWNGQDAAFRMFAIVGIILLILIHPDTDLHPLGQD